MAELQKNTIWQGLDEGWVKVNFYATSCGNLGLAGIGCVPSNLVGEVIGQKNRVCRGDDKQYG